MKTRRAQAALDFLMTYGWALLLITLSVAALASLGIFDLGSFVGSRASGFSQIGAVGWRIDPAGSFTMKMKNNAGTDINITSINATYGAQAISYSTPTEILNGDQSGILIIGAFANPSPGSSYSAKVGITYVDLATNNTYVDSGTVSGRIG